MFTSYPGFHPRLRYYAPSELNIAILPNHSRINSPPFFKEGWHDVLRHARVVRPFRGLASSTATAQILSRGYADTFLIPALFGNDYSSWHFIAPNLYVCFCTRGFTPDYGISPFRAVVKDFNFPSSAKLPIVPGHGNVWKAVMTGRSGHFTGRPCFRFFLYMSEKLKFKGQHSIKNYLFKRKERSDSPETSFGAVPYLKTLAFLGPRSFRWLFSSFSIVPSLRPTT